MYRVFNTSEPITVTSIDQHVRQTQPMTKSILEPSCDYGQANPRNRSTLCTTLTPNRLPDGQQPK